MGVDGHSDRGAERRSSAGQAAEHAATGVERDDATVHRVGDVQPPVGSCGDAGGSREVGWGGGVVTDGAEQRAAGAEVTDEAVRLVGRPERAVGDRGDRGRAEEEAAEDHVAAARPARRVTPSASSRRCTRARLP